LASTTSSSSPRAAPQPAPTAAARLATARSTSSPSETPRRGCWATTPQTRRASTASLGGAVTINEALNTNTSGSTRIDLVTLKILDAGGKAQTTIVQGTPGAGAPALPANSLLLAQVTCVDSFSVIAAAQIADTRLRAYHHVLSATPGGDVNLTNNAWTDICTLPLLTLANDRTVRFEARAEMFNTHVTQSSQVAIRIIDTSNGNAFILGSGKDSMGENAAGFPDHVIVYINESVPVLAGAHTYKLQGFAVNGTAVVEQSVVAASQTLICTRLAAVL
jgi:hypothetical protein